MEVKVREDFGVWTIAIREFVAASPPDKINW